MKYYIIAGEASGDLHGANLMRALLQKDPAAEFRFWGGDAMAAIGGTPVRHIRDLAIMGLLKWWHTCARYLATSPFAKKTSSNGGRMSWWASTTQASTSR